MSGMEAFAVLGVISSIITILETSKTILDAANDSRGLPEAFRKAAENVPVILRILVEAKRVGQTQEQTINDDGDSAAHKQLVKKDCEELLQPMKTCQKNAESLNCIFEKCCPNQDASRRKRFTVAFGATFSGRKAKEVERLLQDTLNKLQLLHELYAFQSMTTLDEIQKAINTLGKGQLAPSATTLARRNDQHASESNHRDVSPLEIPYKNPKVSNEPPRHYVNSYTPRNYAQANFTPHFNNDGAKIGNQGYNNINAPQTITL